MHHSADMQWTAKRFDALNTHELHDLIKLRIDVFVVEQNCPYPELDGLDTHPDVIHLMGSQNQQLSAYLRVLGPGVYRPDTSLGRIIVAPHARGQRQGEPLVRQGIALARQHFDSNTITIGAQHALLDFYQLFGFIPCSEPYLEDGIPHIDMTLRLKGD